MPKPINPPDYSVKSYDEFRVRALNADLTANEKCAIPETFRAGLDAQIFADIASKLTILNRPGARICDIGAGCSELSRMIIASTAEKGQSLTVVDCPEMLDLLPDYPHLTKVEGPFPECLSRSGQDFGSFDGILSYGVIQTVFISGNLHGFVDRALQLLHEGGQLLLGDVTNSTMRKRFIASAAGRAYHRRVYSHLPSPETEPSRFNIEEMDDAVILGLIARARGAGFHAYLLPQAPELPMAGRREDILMVRP